MKPLIVGDGLLLGVEPLVRRKPEVLQRLTAECIDVSKSQAVPSQGPGYSQYVFWTGQKGCEVNGTLYQVGTSGAQAL